MTHIEISKALALAIGWEKPLLSTQGIVVPTGQMLDKVKSSGRWWKGYRRFDYRDPAVIWPIAERYSVFPSSVSNGDYAAAEKQGYPINRQWECLRWHYEKINGKARGWVRYEADTAAKAVALAVIGGKA